MSNVDLSNINDFGQLLARPQTITPVVPHWEGPKFDRVGAMQAAQQYLRNQQALDTARAQDPLNTQKLQADVADIPRHRAFAEAQLHIAQRGASPEADAAATAGYQEQTAASVYGLNDAQLKTAWPKAMVFDQTATYLESIKDPVEYQRALDNAERLFDNVGLKNEFLDFKTNASGTDSSSYFKSVHQQAQDLTKIIQNRATMNYGAGGAAYAASVRGENQLIKQATLEAKDLRDEGKFEPTPEEEAAGTTAEDKEADYITQRFNLLRSLPTGGLPPRAAAPAAAGAAAAAAPGIQADQKAAEQKLAPKQARSPAVAKAAAEHPDAAVYDGPDDEAAQIKWFNSLPLNTPYIDPGTGQFVPFKKAHFDTGQ